MNSNKDHYRAPDILALKDQASLLLENLKDLDLDDQVDACEALHSQADRLYQNLSKSLLE
ncbi:Rop family plasmid primer RNA-binding protein [unidentified bacterial endosymbiont]|uniref:Rop family plasmid primer RNA-binding protein n=1 Tax=unidentified bacterial endosymbiont TaxID=2355 RepID=UPI00344CC43C